MGEVIGMFETVKFIKKNDPSAKSYLEVILLYPGLHALFAHRIAHFFYKIRLYFLARFIMNISRFFTKIEIHPGAKIAKKVFIDHGAGTVIGETAIVEDNVVMFHGVTLGGRGHETTGKRHPTIKCGAMIAAGAKVLGDVTVGMGAKIGANTTVLTDVPAYATAVGAKARIIEKAVREMYDDSLCAFDEKKED